MNSPVRITTMKTQRPLFVLAILSTCLFGLLACKTTEEVRRDGGALERQLNYENAVQQEEAMLGPVVY